MRRIKRAAAVSPAGIWLAERHMRYKVVADTYVPVNGKVDILVNSRTAMHMTLSREAWLDD